MNNLFFHIKLLVAGVLISLHLVAQAPVPTQPVVETQAPEVTVQADTPVEVVPVVVRKKKASHIESVVAPVVVSTPVDTTPTIIDPTDTAVQVQTPEPVVAPTPVVTPDPIVVPQVQSAPISDPVVTTTPVTPTVTQDTSVPAVALYDLVPPSDSSFQPATALTEQELRDYAVTTSAYPSVTLGLETKDIKIVIGYLQGNGFVVTQE